MRQRAIVISARSTAAQRVGFRFDLAERASKGNVTMLTRVVLIVAVIMMSATGAWAQRGVGAPGQATERASPAQMVGQVERGCFTCHDVASAVPKGPNRQALWQMTPEQLYEAISTGPKADHIKVQTEIVNEAQRRAAAELITGKAFGGGAERAAAAMKNRCTVPLTLDPARPQWNGFSPDVENKRLQSPEAARLTAEQVPGLKLKWAFAMPGAFSAGQTQPTIFGGAVFVASDNNYIYALDARSGCVYWSYDARNLMRGSVVIAPVKDVPGVKYGAYIGDYMGRMNAVNAETGAALWTIQVDSHPGAKITSAPVVDPTGTRLYVPVASWEEQTGAIARYECCKFQGSVVAVDVKNGKKVWQTYSFSERPHQLNKTNSLGKEMWGPAGAGIWNTPTIDVKRKALYVGTGNCYTTEWYDTPDFDSVTQFACNSIMAFDMNTGKHLWSTQVLPGDHDEGGCGRGPEERRVNCPGYIQGPGYDTNQTTLLEMANGRRMVIASEESGRVTAVDPDKRGAKVWWSQASETPPNRAEVHAPWGGATDGQLFFRGMPYPDGTGAVAALKPENGQRSWYVPLTKDKACADAQSPTCRPGIQGGTILIPGVLFSGSRDGVMRAFSTKDGKILWQYDTAREYPDTVNGVPGKGGAIGGPGGASVADGMLYLTSGYAILGGAPGNVVLAFAPQ
jgi:polyvinyl alcohol dehydrogenase (cytochrome)